MILECAFDELVQNVGRNKLVYVRARKIICKRLSKEHG